MNSSQLKYYFSDTSNMTYRDWVVIVTRVTTSPLPSPIDSYVKFTNFPKALPSFESLIQALSKKSYEKGRLAKH